MASPVFGLFKKQDPADTNSLYFYYLLHCEHPQRTPALFVPCVYEALFEVSHDCIPFIFSEVSAFQDSEISSRYMISIH